MREDEILAVLDDCSEAFCFPMLDNGYVYLAATRMSVFRSPEDWAIAIEVFGYSPRAGNPDIHVYTFGSTLRNSPKLEEFDSKADRDQHLVNNPNNESSFFYPVDLEPVLDPANPERIDKNARQFLVRGKSIAMPPMEAFKAAKVALEEAPRVYAYELCRVLAHVARDDVLATTSERCTHVPEHLKPILVLDEWHHPDVIDQANKPSQNETFQQISKVLVTGDISHYAPTLAANTHWENWPEGGSL